MYIDIILDFMQGDFQLLYMYISIHYYEFLGFTLNEPPKMFLQSQIGDHHKKHICPSDFE